jgi:geranylgeranyl reductase family protein
MNVRHDVVVIGAGPAGSYAAYCLAVQGYDVLVLEEHPLVGKPTNCSGLIGVEAFANHDLPTKSILRTFDAARFFSPRGAEALVSANRTVAYVVDRGGFDRSLAQQAEAAGASYRLGAKCLGISLADGGVQVKVRGLEGEEQFRARAAIVATGVKYGLLTDLGMARPERFIEAAQAEVRMKDVKEVEVYLGREISPGSFGWAIPLDDEKVRLGVCNGGRALWYLQKLLENPLVKPRLLDENPRIKSKPIPISPAKRSYLDHVLLVGDAAGQAKPTTGGGIYYGILCAEIAARTLDEAFASGDFSERQMARYESRWRREIGLELRVGAYFRRLGCWLSDGQIDHLIRSYKNPELRDLLQRTAAFERHSGFIFALCRSQIFWNAFWAAIRPKLSKLTSWSI